MLRQLTESGHAVTVVPTEAALHFVGEPTWAALSGRPVAADVWTAAHEVPHVRLGRAADLVLVVPATADLLARAVAGRADDLLTSTLLTATCPQVFAPAMHTEMWEHPATRANVATLRERGALVIEPGSGPPDRRRLRPRAAAGSARDRGDRPFGARPCAVTGGRPSWDDLAGRHVVVSAGGTREPLDPVRFLGNRSTGRQGYAVARAAALRGAPVTLVSANVELPEVAGVDAPSGSRRPPSWTGRGAKSRHRRCDAVVMTAAVADFRPVAAAAQRSRRSTAPIPSRSKLTRNADILAELVRPRQRRRAAAAVR